MCVRRAMRAMRAMRATGLNPIQINIAKESNFVTANVDGSCRRQKSTLHCVLRERAVSPPPGEGASQSYSGEESEFRLQAASKGNTPAQFVPDACLLVFRVQGCQAYANMFRVMGKT
jgi:hypothetical protein